MQDQEDYLSNKPTLLSSPGFKYNNLYYSQMNATADLIECSYVSNKYVFNLSSPTFGATSTISLPNRDFIGTTFLNITLPALEANQSIGRGFGYNMIESIAYTIGSSNVSQLSISGATNWQIICAQCKTSEKRSELWKLGGEQQIGASSGPLRGTIALALPWSTMCDKLYLDSTLLSSNLLVTIAFKPSSAVYGGSARPALNAPFTCSLSYRAGELTDKSKSLRNQLILHPDLDLVYPMFHHQSINLPAFAGIPEGSGSNQVVLQGFINSDLVGIIMYCVPKLDVIPVSNNTPNPFNSVDMINVKIQYNGNTMYYSPGTAYKVLNILDNQEGASFFENSHIPPTGNSVATNNYFLYYDISKSRSGCTPEHMSNVLRLSNQVLTVDFNMPDTVDYLFYATYVYNGVCQFKNGNSFLYFD
jgi:hypothetical protein